MIDEYFKQEHINDFKCEKCKKTGEIVKTQEILAFPQILVTNVKRFVFSPKPKKLNNKIGLKIKIDLSNHYTDGHHDISDDAKRFFKDQKVKSKYKLNSYVEHFGQLEFGHYIANCHNSIDDSWTKFNDGEVEVTLKSKDFNRSAASVYVMFFDQDK